MSTNRTSEAVARMSDSAVYLLKQTGKLTNLSVNPHKAIAFTEKYKRMEEALQKIVSSSPCRADIWNPANDALSFDPLSQ